MAVNKKIGGKAQSANDFLAPYAPTIGTATDVGTARPYNNGAATVTFTATGPNTADSFTAYAVEDPTKTATGASSPLTVTGLAAGTNYTFKVYGTNTAGGRGSDSSASGQITATTVPAAPTLGAITNTCSGRAYNNGLVTVAMTANATGGKAISDYYAISNGGQNASGASSPVSVTGLSSATNYTFQGRVSNANGNSDLTSSSSAVTVTTVPATPSAPTVTTAAVGGASAAGSANSANDTVSWTAPATGGSAITNYYWASSDGKSGNTGSLSVVVGQESGTAQTYTVRVDNACGSSSTSPASGSITSAFSFTPFGFTPFGFVPFAAFSFVPFGAFGFTPFGFAPFGFTPFAFTPMFAAFGAFGAFGFTPMFGAFGAFSAFGFTPAPMFGAFGFFNSISILTEVLVAGAPGTTKLAGELEVGDVLLGVNMGTTADDWLTWTSSDLSLDQSNIVETTITAINREVQTEFIYIDGDLFSKSHYILVKKNGVSKFIKATDIDTTYQIFSPESASFVDISLVETVYMNLEKVSINCEPYDNFFTKKMLVFDRPDSQI